MDLIKDRLAHILRAKNLTATQFAELMQIQPSNVSHLLNGRNNPSLDFLIKLKEVFPEYSFDWIIMGKKPITINEPSPITSEQQIFSFSNENIEKSVKDFAVDEDNSLNVLDNHQNMSQESFSDKTKNQFPKNPIEIIYIFEDNSFQIYHIRS